MSDTELTAHAAFLLIRENYNALWEQSARHEPVDAETQDADGQLKAASAWDNIETILKAASVVNEPAVTISVEPSDIMEEHGVSEARALAILEHNRDGIAYSLSNAVCDIVSDLDLLEEDDQQSDNETEEEGDQ